MTVHPDNFINSLRLPSLSKTPHIPNVFAIISSSVSGPPLRLYSGSPYSSSSHIFTTFSRLPSNNSLASSFPSFSAPISFPTLPFPNLEELHMSTNDTPSHIQRRINQEKYGDFLGFQLIISSLMSAIFFWNVWSVYQSGGVFRAPFSFALIFLCILLFSEFIFHYGSIESHKTNLERRF